MREVRLAKDTLKDARGNIWRCLGWLFVFVVVVVIVVVHFSEERDPPSLKLVNDFIFINEIMALLVQGLPLRLYTHNLSCGERLMVNHTSYFLIVCVC